MRELIDKLAEEIELNKKEQGLVSALALNLTKTNFKHGRWNESLVLIKKFFNVSNLSIQVIDDLQWVRIGTGCKKIFDKYDYQYIYRYDGESMEDIFAIFKKFCIQQRVDIRSNLNPENDKKLQIPLQMAKELFSLAFRETLIRHQNNPIIKEYIVLRDLPKEVDDVFGDLTSEL